MRAAGRYPNSSAAVWLCGAENAQKARVVVSKDRLIGDAAYEHYTDAIKRPYGIWSVKPSVCFSDICLRDASSIQARDIFIWE